MAKTRQLLRREITYESAKEKEVNILHQLGYHDKQTRFFSQLSNHHDWIASIVAHHLHLHSSTACHVADISQWLHGSFNVCIPVTINNDKGSEKRVLVRIPLPYRVGEGFMPGNGDEKVRCEAGAYAWLQEYCSDVPIAQLHGFALSTGEAFTHIDNLPFLHRWMKLLQRRLWSWLGLSTLSRYVPHPIRSKNTACFNYLLLEYIEPDRGTMLSNTWMDSRHDTKLRANLFRGLSRILLSISQKSLPRIGSFIIDHKGYLVLANRPLSMELQQLENERIPTDIKREYTFSTVDSYLTDLLTVHDNRFQHQPNAVNNLGDCIFQLSSLTGMRTIAKSFFQRDLRRGPFLFSLTDLHQSNIFVDEEWNVTCLVDLEWACVLPIEMIRPPHWLTGKGVDEIDPAEYDMIRAEFMDALATEEDRYLLSILKRRGMLLSEIMDQTWKAGTFWYTLALSSPSGLFMIFKQHIRPLFCQDYLEEFNIVMPLLWDRNVGYIAGRKLADREEYDRELRREFGVSAE